MPSVGAKRITDEHDDSGRHDRDWQPVPDVVLVGSAGRERGNHGGRAGDGHGTSDVHGRGPVDALVGEANTFSGVSGEAVWIACGGIELDEFGVDVHDGLPVLCAGVEAQLGLKVSDPLPRLEAIIVAFRGVAVVGVNVEDHGVRAAGGAPVTGALRITSQLVAVGEPLGAFRGGSQARGLWVMRVAGEQIVEQTDRGLVMFKPQITR